jgi:hypothetical protein
MYYSEVSTVVSSIAVSSISTVHSTEQLISIGIKSIESIAGKIPSTQGVS